MDAIEGVKIDFSDMEESSLESYWDKNKKRLTQDYENFYWYKM